MTTLFLVFKKIEGEDRKYDAFNSDAKAEKNINESDIDDLFQSVNSTNTSNIQKSLGSSRIIGSVIDHTISISKYNPLAESSYIKIPKQLDHPRKGLVNIQNIGNNECF